MRTEVFAVLCLSVILSGCNLNANRSGVPLGGASQASSGVAGAKLTGTVHGGQQPIAGAHVYLLAAGAGGYGGAGIAASASNASVSLLTNVPGSTALDTSGGATNGDYYVTTDTNGNFAITGDYSCTSGQQVYLYALGGDPGAGTNPAAGLMAVLGTCPAAGNFLSATPYIVVNEVSTVAAAYAMAGFATDAVHVSSSGTAQALTGIANAFTNASNLETLGAGAALATTPAGNGTVPQTEINTLADVLAACVNTDGTIAGPSNPTPCYTLFTSALASGTAGAQPTDTAAAAINVAHNPIANVSALFRLQSADAPFQPTLTAAPNDWTLAVSYTTVQLDTNGNGASQGALAIDAQGNVWIVNRQTTSLNTAPSVSELSSNGAIRSSAAGFTGGGLGGSSNTPGSIAIDLSGNVWVSNGYYSDLTANPPSFQGLGLTEFSSTGTPLSGASGYTTGCGGQGLAIDGSGNVWTSAGKCDSSANYLFAVPSPAPYYSSYPNEASSISIDTSENAWYSGITQITIPHGSTTTQGGVWKVSNSGTMLFETSTFPPSSGFGGASYIANDHAGEAWFLGGPSTSPLGIYELSGSGTTLFTASPTTGTFYLAAPVAIDGAGNVWVGNDDFNLDHSTGLVEVSNSGTTLSGTTGFVSEQPAPSTSYNMDAVSGVGVDGSGNVWAALYSHPYVLQYVGAATPVVTPLSVGVKNGTLGTRP